ncbi:restriction endonuclease [uncultured Megasphaera sp.]|uniref:restriction endonuclease n=1 Tax=uncultured Megasphaera sp. TaxID=165188 RepID=UPI0025FB2393|nr:restriction endonuclease [uncultured Megasphaera sp.]
MEDSKTKRIPFDRLEESDLYVDAVYESGTVSDLRAEVLHHLLPKCGSSGGFRKVKRKGSNKFAYVVLYTSMEELEWPDFLDTETGIFRYYGDNRKPGRLLTDTKLKGNQLLEDIFDCLNGKGSLDDIPPFLIFKKTGERRNVQFLGLAVPGNPKISPDRDLVAFWRTSQGERFQNYEAYFTVLDTGEKPISRKWLQSLIDDHEHSNQYAPAAWLAFQKSGRNGIKALQAPRLFDIPTKMEQMQCNEMGRICLDKIRKHYKKFSQGFELCAVNIAKMMDNNFQKFNLTRPWRDGGRDAIGTYAIQAGSAINYPLRMECALEAKCYGMDNSVGVREMSRLISRIRYRQFGIMITTSFVDKQAYREVVEDGHPILIVTAADIARILINNSIDKANIESWLGGIDETNLMVPDDVRAQWVAEKQGDYHAR